MPDEQLLFFNGINGVSGEFALPPMTGGELSSFIRGESKPENLSELRFRYQQQTARHLGVKAGVDPKKLAETGWGVIFAHDADPAVKEALSELLALRREQAGEHFRLYEGEDGYRPGESKGKFLARHGAGPGPADPEKVPYYLLIVGSPEAIPYRFQSQLDVQYAVGRIHFDTHDEYASYARSVVAAERNEVTLPRRLSFFGVSNTDDKATELSTRHLITPLAQKLRGDEGGWQVETLLADEATKAGLAALLAGDQTPAVLFTASHGMSFPLDSDRQLLHQGALLCQDWPGPKEWHGEIPQEFYFAGDDLGSETNLLGMIAFFFACYGAGTPQKDEFAKQAFQQPAAIAPHPFSAQLPLKMLGRPRGGALAAIGHVERAWGYSFLWPGAGQQTAVFESTLQQLLDGYPVGAAIEFFNERYAELATVLSDELEEIDFGKNVDAYELAGMWTANNDARGYAVLGDPAVRLSVATAGEDMAERPTIVVQPQGGAADGPAAVDTPADGGLPAEETSGENVGEGASLSAAADMTRAGTAGSEVLTVTTTAAGSAGAPGIRTRIDLHGTTETVVSAGAESLAALHGAMVREAVQARLAYLEQQRRTQEKE